MYTKAIILFTFIVSGTCFANDSLVAWYTLDDGQALDVSFNQLHGAAIRVTPTVDRFNKAGRALAFNRDSRSYVIAPKPASLLDGSAITVTAWVKFADTLSNMQIVQSNGQPDGQDGAAFALTFLGNDGCHAGGGCDPHSFGLELLINGEQFSGAWSTAKLTNGQWYHLAATYDGNRVVLYLNGTSDSVFLLTGLFESSDLEINIGRFSSGNVYFNGVIDDVRIYNRALSAEEVNKVSRGLLVQSEKKPQGTSCAAIKNTKSSARDGVYTVDPDGNGGNSPFNVYCDMTTLCGGWTIIFKSKIPGLWGSNTGIPGTGEWSQNFSVINYPMNELMVHDPAGGRVEALSGISSAGLYQCTAGNDSRYWNGTLTDAFGAFHLGIHTTETKRPEGYVIVSHGCIEDALGWGFGHLAFLNDQQGWGWDSDNLGPTVFAIGVR